MEKNPLERYCDIWSDLKYELWHGQTNKAVGISFMIFPNEVEISYEIIPKMHAEIAALPKPQPQPEVPLSDFTTCHYAQMY